MKERNVLWSLTEKDMNTTKNEKKMIARSSPAPEDRPCIAYVTKRPPDVLAVSTSASLVAASHPASQTLALASLPIRLALPTPFLPINTFCHRRQFLHHTFSLNLNIYTKQLIDGAYRQSATPQKSVTAYRVRSSTMALFDELSGQDMHATAVLQLR